MKELKFEELNIDQKIGMVHAIMIHGSMKPEEIEFTFDLIKKRSLGAIWLQDGQKNVTELMEKVKEIADYPILIFSDCESGIADLRIGRHNPIACTGDEKYAYAFGKVLGATARKMGYNVICNPLMDISSTGSARSFGPDKYKVAKIAAAEARGMHDGGVLTVGKHYPSSINPSDVDTHMAESHSPQTEEELVEHSLYAYLELIKEDLLDGIMVGHESVPKIDPVYPASLSKPIINVIKKRGFNGFCISDALGMMGIRAKFGDVESKGMAVEAGIDLALPFGANVRESHQALKTCYEKGIISEERLDEAVKKVLEIQHKVMLMSEKEYTDPTEEEINLCRLINKDSIFAQVEEGLTASVSKEGKHLFALMIRNEERISNSTVTEDTFTNGWLHPTKVINRITELFPNSKVVVFHEFPSNLHNHKILHSQVNYDDVVFITFSEFLPYAGGEKLTYRVVRLIEALQCTNRISALVHFGNPCVLEELPHIPRVIIGGISEESVNASLEVLAGDYEAKGVKTYDFELK